MAEEETKAAGPIRMAAIYQMMEKIRYKGQIIARTNKLESGIMDSGLLWFTKGIFISMVLIVVPVMALGMI